MSNFQCIHILANILYNNVLEHFVRVSTIYILPKDLLYSCKLLEILEQKKNWPNIRYSWDADLMVMVEYNLICVTENLDQNFQSVLHNDMHPPAQVI